MKHYSPQALVDAAVRAIVPNRSRVQLLTEDQVKERVRAQLDGTMATRTALAERAGLSDGRLSAMLRGGGIGDETAARLGFRKVVRFEPID